MSTQWIRLDTPAVDGNSNSTYVKPYTIQKVEVIEGCTFVTFLDAGSPTCVRMYTVTPIEDILLLNDDYL